MFSYSHSNLWNIWSPDHTNSHRDTANFCTMEQSRRFQSRIFSASKFLTCQRIVYRPHQLPEKRLHMNLWNIRKEMHENIGVLFVITDQKGSLSYSMLQQAENCLFMLSLQAKSCGHVISAQFFWSPNRIRCQSRLKQSCPGVMFQISL